ncbi:DEAD/DEAH box helicase family protein [Streptomyces cylindrosporus]|uniref:DEAD/DEAH box helicase family protein n=1 Tax=Streptomyces cylindrosporus TaxID=2927583 RepID=A0ABS9YKW2_9ACTN|nr:DEAD/DEAH box helicase family protein [Streptomyces cylindrosporus]MCI3276481.1 DEAD/DEAH box helicase family protein [Streptomyces cylindrosporus]
MTQRIVSDLYLSGTGWQAFERTVQRLLVARGYSSVQLAGASGDGGADVIGTLAGRRWLFQVKRWRTPVGPEVVAQTIAACRRYDADVPVVVSLSGFQPAVRAQQQQLAADGIPLQLWDRRALFRQAERVPAEPLSQHSPDRYELRSYQADAVDRIMNELINGARSALVVLATGLGKTFVAAEFHRRFTATRPSARTLVLAHRNELVYQLERSFWPMLPASAATGVWNGHERPDPDALADLDIVFACVDSVASAVTAGRTLPEFGLVIVDECHHLGTKAYDTVLDELSAGDGGSFLVGMTATPWRPDGRALRQWFDFPIVDIDMVRGLREGYLANVDYRMYTDNLDWDALTALPRTTPALTPRGINKTLFIEEWDDAVVERLAETWHEQTSPRAIVFCGTIDHAERMAARINALGFTNADVIASRSADGKPASAAVRSQTLWDFADGRTGVLCAVDILNEGVDVPDVNIVVFQRVTHSRRIFVQQLGRGLRLSPGKNRVIVLDFVSDIRRFAAGLDLQDSLRAPSSKRRDPRVSIGSKITFMRANNEDQQGAHFLREWLGDLEAVQDAEEDVHILRYPPEDSLDLIPKR